MNLKHKITLLLLLAAIFVYGQNTGRQYIGISVGPSFPGSEFASTNLNDSTSGWAKTGVAIEVSYAYRLTHNIGIYVMGVFSSNKFDIDRYRNALDANHPDTTFSVESARNWSGGGLLVGPYLRLPLSDNFSWDFRGAFGFYSAYSPKVTIRSSASTEPYYRESGSDFSYAYTFGSGFKFKMAKYYFLLFADYFSSSLKFENATGWDWNSEPYVAEFSQKITYVSVSVGLGYYF